jgi:hypothetical protein
MEWRTGSGLYHRFSPVSNWLPPNERAGEVFEETTPYTDGPAQATSPSLHVKTTSFNFFFPTGIQRLRRLKTKGYCLCFACFTECSILRSEREHHVLTSPSMELTDIAWTPKCSSSYWIDSSSTIWIPTQSSGANHFTYRARAELFSRSLSSRIGIPLLGKMFRSTSSSVPGRRRWYIPISVRFKDSMSPLSLAVSIVVDHFHTTASP